MTFITKKTHLLGLLLVLNSSYTLSMETNSTGAPVPTSTETTLNMETQDKEEQVIVNITTEPIEFNKETSENDSLPNSIASCWSFNNEYPNLKRAKKDHNNSNKKKSSETSHYSSFSHNKWNTEDTNSGLTNRVLNLESKVDSIESNLTALTKKKDEENKNGTITNDDLDAFKKNLSNDSIIIATVNYDMHHDEDKREIQFTRKEDQSNSGVYSNEKIIIKDTKQGIGKALINHTSNQAQISKYRNNQQFFTNAAKICKSIFYGASILTAGAIGQSIDYSKIQNTQFELKDVKPKLILVGSLVCLTGASWIGSVFCSNKAKEKKTLINNLEFQDKKEIKPYQKYIFQEE